MQQIIPEGDDLFRHPLFVSPLPFLYRVKYRATRNKNKEITYSTPHEIILNLHAFDDRDRITYVDKEDNQVVFTITVDQSKVTVARTLYEVNHDDLEKLYMRLYLTNRYSRRIIDKGIMMQYDHHLKGFIGKIIGGIDCYLTMENRQEILYLKYRRYSCLHLLAVVDRWNNENYIQMNHINIPKTISQMNQGLLYEMLRVMLNKKSFRLYSYEPVEEDNIKHPTKIDSEIIAVINKLIL